MAENNIEKVITSREVEEEIQKAEKEGRPANFEGKTIESIHLAGKKISVPLKFPRATIKGNLDLGGTTMKGTLDLFGATIGGNLDLGRTTIEENLWLQRAIIKGNLGLRGAVIREGIYLEEAIIEGSLYLGGLKYKQLYADFSVAVAAHLSRQSNIIVPPSKIDDFFHPSEEKK